MVKNSHVLAEDPEVDLAVATAMVDELEAYIVKAELYRTLIVRTPRGDEKIIMTGADLLTRLFRLQGVRPQATTEMQQAIDAVQARADAVIYSLRTRFDQQLQREMKARLDSLRWYLDDCIGDPVRCRTNYPYEIRNRQRIEEILKRVGVALPPELHDSLRSVDQRIRQLTHGTPFVWDERLRPIFPAAPYWYLYASP